MCLKSACCVLLVLAVTEDGTNMLLVVQATVCAKFGIECVVYMGAKDMERQKLNVFRMRLLGADVRPVRAGTSTLKDATSEAIRDWVTNVETTHYILGSAAGPHPYPMMVSTVLSSFCGYCMLSSVRVIHKRMLDMSVSGFS